MVYTNIYWYIFLHTDYFILQSTFVWLKPIIPETHKLVHFNVMFAHLFISKSQGMSLYEIILVKTLTIDLEALVDCSFPAIKATDNIALPFLGPRTVAYIHALIVDSVILLQAESPNTEALQNESWFAKNL